MKSKKYIHEKGQYFTKNEFLKEAVYNLILNNPTNILEPSCGRGDLIKYIQSKRSYIHFDSYEIDESIQILNPIDKSKIIYGDFLLQEINKKYCTIIGNPPYVKTTNGNMYIDFIYKCYCLLQDNGELIFIVPSDFIKLTSSSNVINEMMNYGTFTHIIHPNKENLFEEANIDVIIFRYCKNKELDKKVVVNGEEKYLINTNGILTYSNETNISNETFADYFDIYVGMVTGKEDVFKNDTHGNTHILNGKNKLEKYVLLSSFPSQNKELNNYMLSHKNSLISRKIKKFNERNWFEWGALRNYKTIKNKIGNDCIYVYNVTRSNEICFKGKVQYFGGSLITMIPKKKVNLDTVINYMNSDTFKSNYMYSGRFKIGHKQLCNCLFNIPSN